MHNSKLKFQIVQAITWYRILAAPVLLLLIWKDKYELFRWLLIISFLTDAIDGYLARRFKVSHAEGARIDSAGDDLTVIVAVIGMFKWNGGFVWEMRFWAASLLLLLIVQILSALIKYRKMTAYHTYISKTAAILQAVFLCCSFFCGYPSVHFFSFTVLVTGLGLMEETAITILLRDYRSDVKGLYWLLKKT